MTDKTLFLAVESRFNRIRRDELPRCGTRLDKFIDNLILGLCEVARLCNGGEDETGKIA